MRAGKHLSKPLIHVTGANTAGGCQYFDIIYLPLETYITAPTTYIKVSFSSRYL